MTKCVVRPLGIHGGTIVTRLRVPRPRSAVADHLLHPRWALSLRSDCAATVAPVGSMYRSDTSDRWPRGRQTGDGRRTVLDLAILGILHESPMHGYELRKQLATKMGAFRAAISYGSLYPTLRRLQAAGWITEGAPPASAAADAEIPPMTSRRGRVVYKITAEGKERF